MNAAEPRTADGPGPTPSPPPGADGTEPSAVPAPLEALMRHFGDLRDGTHGGQVTRAGKEEAFRRCVELLDAPARRVLDEFNRHLLRDTGTVRATGLLNDEWGGSYAAWQLTWPEQTRTRIAPITLHAHYGAGFHHPHLRGATLAEWPLNVFSAEQAEELVPVMRAIAAADLHNLVFERDWRIVPVMHPVPRPGATGPAPAPER